MEKNFLLNKINSIQKEYLELLVKLKDNIDTIDYIYIIDEINIFWYSYRDIIKLYLGNITQKDNAYIFTGATYLDVDDLEHYPFIMMGDIHIVDDSLCKYSKTVPGLSNQEFAKVLKDQIISCIDDNIKILSNYSFAMLILPMNLLYGNDMKIIHEYSNNIFLNFFSRKDLNLDTYFEEFDSIEDIALALNPGIESYIVFDEGEDLTKSLEERFKSFIDKGKVPLPAHKNDAFKFWMIIYGFIAQALDIILSCKGFNLIPYLRYRVTLQYVLLLGDNIFDIEDISNMLLKCKVAHVLYVIFDKSVIKNISFAQFYKKLNEYKFSYKVENDIKENININQIAEILNKNITSFLGYI